jgi:hypothetical protein
MQSSDVADPGLHTGLTYFVPQAAYKFHILKYATEKDVSDIYTLSVSSINTKY